jgi:hypothetical protein
MKILIIGCSFSETFDGVLKYPTWVYWLSHYLKNENVDIINLSKSGNGNKKISTDVINYLKYNKVDLVLVQWSAFTRVFGNNLQYNNDFLHLIKGSKEYYNIDWEYGDEYFNLLDEKYIVNSLESILETIQFLNNNNINYKMWFGWQQIYPEQINYLNLNHLIEPIKSDPNFLLFYQKEMYDYELENYGLFSKSNYLDTLHKLFGIDKKKYYYPETEWGGMTEYIRMNLEANKYRSNTDAHPSELGSKIFFEGVIKLLFPSINENIKLI